MWHFSQVINARNEMVESGTFNRKHIFAVSRPSTVSVKCPFGKLVPGIMQSQKCSHLTYSGFKVIKLILS